MIKFNIIKKIKNFFNKPENDHISINVDNMEWNEETGELIVTGKPRMGLTDFNEIY